MIETTPELVKAVYIKTRKNIGILRTRLGRPMTLAEKVLLSHLIDPQNEAQLYLRNRRGNLATRANAKSQQHTAVSSRSNLGGD